jgi:hypothetical protein
MNGGLCYQEQGLGSLMSRDIVACGKEDCVMSTRFTDDDVPYFCWDRPWTVREIREQLASSTGKEWIRLMAWILREAATGDVWAFVRPQDVWERFNELEPFLGRRRRFWRYIMETWHELGKV